MTCNTSKSNRHRTTAIKVALALLVASACAAMAQGANPDQGQQAIGAATLAHVQARVIGIEPDSNSVTLRGPRGNIAVIEMNPEVANVKKLKIGDVVDIVYKNALLIGVDKVATSGIRERIDTETAIPASGGVVATARRVEVLATVQKIDRKHRQVTLRGPTRTEVLDVAPDVSLDNLKVGDSVRAVFVAAAAAQVSRDGVDIK